ncbi:MAG: peptidoglycan-binding protein [Pseudomonadales bacterium]
MNDLLVVLLLAALPAIGNFAGGALAELRPPTARHLNFALHAAAGIVLAVVAVELMPRALERLPAWMIGLGFAGGGLLYVALDALVTRLQSDQAGTGAWMIYGAVAVDLFTDGLLIGAGSSVNLGLGLVLAVGQVMADLPEGYAVIANLRERGIPRRQRIWLSAAFLLPALGAATVAYLLLRGQPSEWQLSVLMVGAGLLTVAAIEDMIGEAHEGHEDERRSLVALVGGFVLFTLISAGLGA